MELHAEDLARSVLDTGNDVSVACNHPEARTNGVHAVTVGEQGLEKTIINAMGLNRFMLIREGPSISNGTR